MASNVFSFSILVGLLVATLLILLCVVIPDPLMAFCGVTKYGKPVLYEKLWIYD